MREGGKRRRRAAYRSLRLRSRPRIYAVFPVQPAASRALVRHSARPQDVIVWPPIQRPPVVTAFFSLNSTGIEAQPVRQFVDLRFGGERHLRVAVAAETGGAQPVGVDDAAAKPAMGYGVGSARHQQAEAEHGRTVLGIGAAVVDDLEVAGDQRSVGLRAGLYADDRRMAPPHHHEILFAGQRQADRPAGRPGEMRHERLDCHAGLAAERAADRRGGSRGFSTSEDRAHATASPAPC